jgi:ethanolamine utilization protein EutN
MHLARVIGTVVATRKYDRLAGERLLIVQPVGKNLENVGEPLVACDGTMAAGEGELVYFVVGREASLALAEPFSPVDAAIVGIVDEVTPEEER